jgi:CRP-like cAMP-binding protein
MKKLSFKKGEIIFKNGEPAFHIYLVISGEVGLFFSTDPKNPYIIIRENETFGEMGVIENELRQSRSSCLSDCEVVQIEREIFLKKYESSESLVKALIKSLSVHLREANKKLMRLR